MTAPLRFALVVGFFFASFFTQGQWTPVNNGITDLSQGAAVLGATNSHLFAKAGTGMYRSADNGDTWSAIQSPIALNPTECGISTDDRYIAGLNSSTACIYYTDDNGDSWTEATGAPTATVVRGFYAYAGGIFAFTSNAGIYVSTNGGSSWQPSNTGLASLNVIGMVAYGPYIAAGTVGAGAYRSPGGSSWTASTGIGVDDLNGENIWNMGSSFYYTAQGGASYRSNDLGETWNPWTAPAAFGVGLLEVKRHLSRLYIESRHLASGLRDSVYVSLNQGVSWTNITGDLNAADLNGSGLLEHDGYVFLAYNIGSPGLGIYRYDLSTGVDERAVMRTPEVFPNPAEEFITIALPATARTTHFAILDATGRSMMTGRMMPGTTQLDIAVLAPGCYVMRWDDPTMAPVRVVKR